jgi:peroxiredoxin Q/BCP
MAIMKSQKLLMFLVACGISFTMQAQSTLKAGDAAPDFTSKDQDGKTVSLHDFKGKKVVLYFYPKDQTPGCTAEACNLRDNISALTDAGYVVLGVSTDDEVSHKAFKDKYSLPFTLIADTDKSINQKYGVWVEKERDGKKFFGTARKTFLINEQGIITEVIEKVDTQQHTAQILK